MRLKRLFIAFLTVTWGLMTPQVRASSPIELSSQSYDFVKSVKYALSHSLRIDSATQNLELAGLDSKVAIARILPSLDLNSQFGLQSLPKIATVSPANQVISSVSLGLNETLYDNGVSYSLIRMSRIKNQIEELNLTKEKNKLCKEVGEQFLALGLQNKYLESAREQFKLLQNQFDLVSQAYHQGLKTRKDYLRLQTDVERSQLELISLKSEVERQQSVLIQVMAMPETEAVGAQFTFDWKLSIFKSVPVEAAGAKVKIDLSQHFDAKLARLQSTLNDLEVRQARRSLFPESQLTSNFGYQSSTFMGTPSGSFTDNGQWGWNVQLGLKYSFWDWGSRRSQSIMAEKKAQIDQNTKTLQLAELQVTLDDVVRRLAVMADSVKLSTELVQLEKNNYQSLETEYHNGKVSYLDLIGGLKNFNEARAKLDSLSFELRKWILEYHYHEGNLYDLVFAK